MPDYGMGGVNPAFHGPERTSALASFSPENALPQPKVVKYTVLPAVSGDPGSKETLTGILEHMQKYLGVYRVSADHIQKLVAAVPSFTAAQSFVGARLGAVFKTGAMGLSYYRDTAA